MIVKTIHQGNSKGWVLCRQNEKLKFFKIKFEVV
nr:MAG TPA: hypothetical protein [Caudoviricetes sp.]